MLLDQVLPVVVKKKYMSPWGLGDGYDESEADRLFVFHQPWASADAQTGLFGGTSEDPTAKAIVYFEVIGGELVGKGTVPSGNTTNHVIAETLTSPILSNGTVKVGMTFTATTDLSFQFLWVSDEVGDQICSVYYGKNTNYLISIFDSAGTNVADIFTNGTTPILTEINLQIVVDLAVGTPTVSVYSDDVVLGKNIDVDISAGGAMTATQIGGANCQLITFFASFDGSKAKFSEISMYQG